MLYHIHKYITVSIIHIYPCPYITIHNISLYPDIHVELWMFYHSQIYHNLLHLSTHNQITVDRDGGLEWIGSLHLSIHKDQHVT